MSGDADGLALLCRAESIAGAHALAAALGDAGIEATVLEGDALTLDLARGDVRSRGVPVCVPAAALEPARRVLAMRDDAAAAVDWSAQDLGDREDDLPLRRPGHMPLIVRAGFIAAVIVLIVSAIAGALALIL